MAYVDGSLLQGGLSRYFDRIVCVHMCGLLVRSYKRWPRWFPQHGDRTAREGGTWTLGVRGWQLPGKSPGRLTAIAKYPQWVAQSTRPKRVEVGHYASSVKFTLMQGRTDGSIWLRSRSASCFSLVVASLSNENTLGIPESAIGKSPVHVVDSGSISHNSHPSTFTLSARQAFRNAEASERSRPSSPLPDSNARSRTSLGNDGGLSIISAIYRVLECRQRVGDINSYSPAILQGFTSNVTVSKSRPTVEPS